MSNCTANKVNAATNSITLELSPNSLESRGTPVKPLILLNFVAVIWGAQHAIFKSVADDSTNS